MKLDYQLAFARAREGLYEIWQGRVLVHTHGQLRAILMSMIAHSWKNECDTLFHAVLKNYKGVERPFYYSTGKIMKDGRIVADLMPLEGPKLDKQPVFSSEKAMERTLRKVADQLRLSDSDRLELFATAKKWVDADFRVGPDGNRIA